MTSEEAFTEIQLNLDKPKKVWVVTKEIEISKLEGKRNIAIFMNAATFSQATEPLQRNVGCTKDIRFVGV